MTTNTREIVERLRAGIGKGPLTPWGETVVEAATLIERLTGALKPFAAIAERYEHQGKKFQGPFPDDWTVVTNLEDCRAARVALEGRATGEQK